MRLKFIVLGVLLVLSQSARASDLDKLLGGLGKVAPLIIKDSQIGTLFTQSLDKQYGIITDSPNLSRVQQIGGKLLSSNNIDGNYDFAILNSGEFNACSIYGGHIRVNAGLLHHTGNSNDELAFILAHEIAHQTEGHNKKVVSTFKIATAAQLVNLDKNMPALLNAGLNAVLANRSRDFEREADKTALAMLVKAGYKSEGAIAIFRRIESEHMAEEKRVQRSMVDKQFARIFASHPNPSVRVSDAEDFVFTQKYGRTFKEVKGIKISSATSFISPTDNMTPSPVSKFGSEWVEKCKCGDWKLHCGVDVALRQVNADVIASADGNVRYAGSFGKGWGSCVIIEHTVPGIGQLTTLYGHIIIETEIKNADLPIPIKQGQLLGKNDPGVKPPHLHFGVRLAPYDSLSIRGALFSCQAEDHQPKFKEYWEDPIDFLASHKTNQSPTYQDRDRINIWPQETHLGDDRPDSPIHIDRIFRVYKEDFARHEQYSLSIWVKGKPRKDPVIFINRHEIGRVITNDDRWHRYEFAVPRSILNEGDNLFHIQAFIPNLWQSFDDCEFKEVVLNLN